MEFFFSICFRSERKILPNLTWNVILHFYWGFFCFVGFFNFVFEVKQKSHPISTDHAVHMEPRNVLSWVYWLKPEDHSCCQLTNLWSHHQTSNLSKNIATICLLKILKFQWGLLIRMTYDMLFLSIICLCVFLFRICFFVSSILFENMWCLQETEWARCAIQYQISIFCSSNKLTTLMVYFFTFTKAYWGQLRVCPLASRVVYEWECECL